MGVAGAAMSAVGSGAGASWQRRRAECRGSLRAPAAMSVVLHLAAECRCLGGATLPGPGYRADASLILCRLEGGLMKIASFRVLSLGLALLAALVAFAPDQAGAQRDRHDRRMVIINASGRT